MKTGDIYIDCFYTLNVCCKSYSKNSNIVGFKLYGNNDDKEFDKCNWVSCGLKKLDTKELPFAIVLSKKLHDNYKISKYFPFEDLKRFLTDEGKMEFNVLSDIILNYCKYSKYILTSFNDELSHEYIKICDEILNKNND